MNIVEAIKTVINKNTNGKSGRDLQVAIGALNNILVKKYNDKLITNKEYHQLHMQLVSLEINDIARNWY